MPGVADVLVQWAPSVTPLGTVTSEWVTLTNWTKLTTSGGQQLDEAAVSQTFNVGRATIRLRNGDNTGAAPTFVPESSYRGIQLRITEPNLVGEVFRGRIDRVEYHYENTPFAAEVTLHCIDTAGTISDANVPDQLFPATVDYFTQVADVETALTLVLTELGAATLPTDGEFSRQLVKAPDEFENRDSLLEFFKDVMMTEGAALYATPDGELVVRGRWAALRLLADGADPPIVFTDTDPNGTTTFGYRRDDLEWSDADEDFVNSVQTRSEHLNKTFVKQNVPSGYPKQQLSRTELVTIRQGWVEANANMWFTLYNQARAYPKKIKFLVATRTQFLPSMYSAGGLGSEGWPTFERQFQVLHTPPGSTQRTYRLAVNSVEHDIDRQRWVTTLGFVSLDRWWFGYGNGTDPIELIQIGGDSDHGIGSTAIIAP